METARPRFEKTTERRAHFRPPSPVGPGDADMPVHPDEILRREARDLGFDEATYMVSPRSIPRPDWRALGTHRPKPERQTLSLSSEETAELLAEWGK